MDVTDCLATYKLSPHDLAMKIIKDVLADTGITATAGIGTNLYLCKVAMDIVAKHIPADENGVRTAELLIDHAWGYEPCTMAEIKAYKPQNNSICQGQVLQSPYTFEKTMIVVREMADMLSLDLVEKGLITNQAVLTVGYDVENLRNSEISYNYHGAVTTDHYGRAIPKHAHGTNNLNKYTSSSKAITKAVTELFERISDKNLLVHRLSITANGIIRESEAENGAAFEQLDFFTDISVMHEEEKAEKREKNMQEAILKIQHRYGKNAVLRGMNLQEGAAAVARNGTIGGHRA